MAGISQSVSEALGLSHAVLWSCAYAYATELSYEGTYVSFSSLSEILKTIRIWVIQDQRVFENAVRVYLLWKGADEGISLVSSFMEYSGLVSLAEEFEEEKQLQGLSLYNSTADGGANYSEIGFYIGDSLGRLVLSLGDADDSQG